MSTVGRLCGLSLLAEAVKEETKEEMKTYDPKELRRYLVGLVEKQYDLHRSKQSKAFVDLSGIVARNKARHELNDGPGFTVEEPTKYAQEQLDREDEWVEFLTQVKNLVLTEFIGPVIDPPL